MLRNPIGLRPITTVFHDGSEAPGGAPTPPPAPSTNAPPATPPAGYVPQDQVSAIAAREKDEGKRAAERAIAEQLGVSIEEAKQIVAAARERDEASKSEAEKAAQAAEKARLKAEERESTAAQKAHAAEVKLALIDAGVPRERLDVVARLVDAEVGADENAIKAAIEIAKTAAPELFGAAPAGDGGAKPPVPPTGSDPAGGAPPKPKGGEGAYERGMEMAKQRNGAGDTYPLLQTS